MYYLLLLTCAMMKLRSVGCFVVSLGVVVVMLRSSSGSG